MPHRTTTLLGFLSLSVLALCLAGCTIYEDDGGRPYPVADGGGAGAWVDAEIGFPDAGIWPPRDGGSWPLPDAGIWPLPDAGIWPLPDAGIWPPRDGGIWPPRDGGIWPPPDGGIWPPPDGGIWPPRDGGIWPPPDAGPGPDAGFSCNAITNEAICVVTPGCDALYYGVNCTCDSNGVCVCDHWVFDRCN